MQQLLARRPGLAVERGDDALDRGPLLGQKLRPARRWRRAPGAPGRVAAASCGSRSGRAARAGAARCGQSRPPSASFGADISPPRSASSTARCLTPSRSPPLSASSPATVSRPAAPAASAPAGPPPQFPVAVPAAARARGSSSTRAAIQRPSPTSSGDAPASSASIGSASRSAGSPRRRRARRRRRGCVAGRREPGQRCRPRDPPSHRAGGSRRVRAARGRWSAARP